MSVPLPAAINLSYWLYRVHPEIFTRLLTQARVKPSLGDLGQDPGSSDFLPGISTMPDTTSYDIGNFGSDTSVATDVSSLSTSDISSAISPDLLSMPDPQLQTVSFDPGLVGAAPNLVSNADVAAADASNPSTASNVGAVAGVITAGLGALAAVTTAIYKAGTPQAATINTQASRVAAGVNPAPITYGLNAQGQLVPILATTAGSSILSPSTLASLGIPSSWSPYIVPIGIVVLVAILMGGSGSKKR